MTAKKKVEKVTPVKKERGLSPKELRFIDEYMVDGNAGNSVIRAGYKCTKGSAYTLSARLLKKVPIQVEIAKKRAELAKKTEISAERVLNELAKIAFSNIGGLFDPKTGGLKKVDQMSPDDLAAVSGISIDELGGNSRSFVTTKKIRMYDKIRALERLGTHLGLFKEKLETNDEIIAALKQLAKDLPG